jgi:ubiquitin-conjugating enzyme E2 variant
VLEAVWIGTALTLIAYHIVGLALAFGLRYPWMPLIMLAGFVTADFLSGVIHWTADTWFRDTLPVLGRRLLKPFRVHHVNPDDFLRRNVLDTNGDVAAIVIPFLIAVFRVSTTEPWSAALAVYVVSFCAAGLPTNQVHQWAHMKNPPTIIRWLQSSRLILSRRAHLQHHKAPHIDNYCIALGWCNPLLTAIGFFPRLERMVTRLTGLQPRHDDQKYYAELEADLRLATDSSESKSNSHLVGSING